MHPHGIQVTIHTYTYAYLHFIDRKLSFFTPHKLVFAPLPTESACSRRQKHDEGGGLAAKDNVLTMKAVKGAGSSKAENLVTGDGY